MKLKLVFYNDFFKDFATLFSGTILASVIPLFFSPIISRLYTAEQFGVFAIVSAVLSIFSNVAAGRYEMAVMLPKKESESKSLVNLAGLISFVVSLFVLAVLLLFYSYFKEINELSSLGIVVFVIPPLLWIMSFSKTINFWFNRNRLFNKNAASKVVQGVGVSVITVLFGYFGSKQGLVLGYFWGWFLYFVVIVFFALGSNFRFFQSTVLSMKSLAIEYQKFPKLNMLSTFLNDFAAYLAIFMISFFYTVEDTGYYNFTRQYLYVPLSLISLTLSSVLFQRISKKINLKQSVKLEILNVFKILLIVSLLTITIVLLFGEELFVWVFGEEWLKSGQLAKVLVFIFAFKFMVSPFGQVLIALKKLRTALVFPIIYTVLMLGLFFFKESSFDDFIFVLVFFEIVAYAVYLMLTFQSVNVYEQKLKLN